MEINKDQKIFVLPSAHGHSCLGFEVCRRRHDGLAAELGAPAFVGSLNNKRHLRRLYRSYERLLALARAKNKATGWRASSELTPGLIGLEGKRVEVVNCWGERVRFIVGRSTGCIPCHLEIKTRRSSGGGAVSGAPFKSITVL